MSLSTFILFAVISVTYASAIGDIGEVIKVMNEIMTRNNMLNAVSVTTFDAQGMRTDATAAIGNHVTGSKLSTHIDTSVRGNFPFEHALVSIVILDLIKSNELPQPDSTIPSALLPCGVSFTSPPFSGTSLTLRQLLSHTSTLTDNNRFDPSPKTNNGKASATDLSTFAKGYFCTTSESAITPASDIWIPDLQPGDIGSYSPSRANTVMLAFILQQLIKSKPALVSSRQKSVGAYIQEQIIAPLGMTSTVFLLPDGTFPLLEGGHVYASGNYLSETNAGGVALTDVRIHPSTIGGGTMTLTSAVDVAKLLRALFLEVDTPFSAIGDVIMKSMENIPQDKAAIRVSNDFSVVAVGLGFARYDPRGICSEATSSGVVTMPSGCAVDWAREVYIVGFISPGVSSLVSGMCVSYDSVQYDSKQSENKYKVCHGVAAGYNSVTFKRPSSANVVSPVIAVAGNQIFIDSIVTEGLSVDEDYYKPSDLFPLTVFFVVFWFIFCVLFVTYMSEYFIQPVAKGAQPLN
eukprot:Tbor_TRINITY_DN5514_c2_g1::TRINITY_DN5514_c2_g1_i1::g.13357::m.13357